MDAQALEKEALELPLDARAQLAHRLILSLDQLSDANIEEAWLIEAERRARELDRGEVQPVSAEEVRRKVRAILR